MPLTIFPLSDLRESFDDDKEIIISILDMFMEEVPQDFLLLKQHVESRSFTAAGMMAHKLKSSYRTLGITKMAGILEDIEIRCKNAEKLNEIPILFKDFEGKYDAINQKIIYTKSNL